jgi:hypothetical protein
MGSDVRRGKKTFRIVREMSVTEDQLDKIAEVLGIPAAERDRIVSGTIYIESSSPTSAESGRARRAPAGRSVRASTTRRRTRQQE